MLSNGTINAWLRRLDTGATSTLTSLNALSALITQGAWTSWTPSWSQSAAITSTNDAKYMRVGRLVVASAFSNLTSAGTAANNVQCTLPVVARYASNAMSIGNFHFNNSTVTFYAGSCVMSANNAIVFNTGTNAGFVGSVPAWTVKNGDLVGFTVMYEAAS